MCAIASSMWPTTRTARIAARNSVSQSSSVAGTASATSARVSSQPRILHPRLGESLGQRREHSGCDGPRDEQRLHRTADPVAVGLRVDATVTAMSGSACSSMKTWQLPSRCLITGTRASRLMRSMSPLPPLGTMTSTCASMAMSNPDRGAIGRLHHLDRIARKSRCRESLDNALGNGEVRRKRLGAPAQDGRVAGFQTQPRGIGGDVGPVIRR